MNRLRERTPTYLLVVATAITLTVWRLWSLYPWVLVPNFDFDLHYFGGIVERQGSYTDTVTVLAKATNNGSAVSAEGLYGGPTLVALLYQPLSLLSLDVAQRTWQIFAVVFLAVAVRRAVGTRWWPLWLCLAVMSASNVGAFGNGNFAITTTALILYAYGSLRDDKHRQAGASLAIAIAFKLYPVFLLLPLIVRGQRATLKWTLAPVAAMFAITPVALGFDDVWPAIRRTMDIAGYVHPWVENNGLPGSVLLATDNQTLAQWTARLAVLLSATIVFGLRKRASTTSLFVVAVMLMTLSQGISWVTYYGTSLVVLLESRKQKPGFVKWIVLGSAYVLANGIVGIDTRDILGLPAGMTNTFGLVVLAAMALSQIPKPATDQASANVTPERLQNS